MIPSHLRVRQLVRAGWVKVELPYDVDAGADESTLSNYRLSEKRIKWCNENCDPARIKIIRRNYEEQSVFVFAEEEDATAFILKFGAGV